MAERINEDIRFYLPADPYYYQVDNLPLEDLVTNDIRLQDQIDELRASDVGETISRSGFSELQPFIDDGIPGTITVRPGSFIGRTQRTADGTFVGGANVLQFAQGIPEMNTPPTIPGEEYNTGNPPNVDQHGANQVGRTSFFQFNGGSVPIDSFDFNGFENRSESTETNAPQARIDLVGITTVEGAFDDPFVPGNDTGAAITGDGHPRLCVVKGAGLISTNGNKRTVKIGEKYITLANPSTSLNSYGRDFEGNIVSDPEFGSVPSPDDVINVCVSRNDIQESLQDWVNNNVNSSFFLPLAYVFVPQTHVEGNNIPSQYLKDIRPFFRTTELSVSERQAVAASINPSVQNPLVTTSHLTGVTEDIVDNLNTQIQSLTNRINSIRTMRNYYLETPQRILQDDNMGSFSNPSVINISSHLIHNASDIDTYFFYVVPTGDSLDDQGDSQHWVLMRSGPPSTNTSTAYQQIFNYRIRSEASFGSGDSRGQTTANFFQVPSQGASNVSFATNGRSLSVKVYLLGYSFYDTP